MPVYHFSISEHRFVRGGARGAGGGAEAVLCLCWVGCHVEMLGGHWSAASAASCPWAGRQSRAVT